MTFPCISAITVMISIRVFLFSQFSLKGLNFSLNLGDLYRHM